MAPSRRAWGTLRPPTVAAVGGSYEGPGDVVASGWVVWYGLRAFSAATRGTACCRIKKTTGGAETDINTDATTGIVDIAAITSHLSGDTGTFIVFYDQVASLDTNTVFDAAAISLGVLGTGSLLPVSTYGQISSAATGVAYSQPFTMVGVGQQNGTATAGAVFRISSYGISFGAGNNTAQLYAGTALIMAAADDTPHALIGVFNGTTSTMSVDSTETVGAGGASTLLTTDVVRFPGDLTVQYTSEGGFNSGAISVSNRAALAANMMAYYGISLPSTAWMSHSPIVAATGTNIDYGTLPIGAADANRVVAVFVGNRNTSAASYATSVTVGGVSMTSYAASQCTAGLTSGQWWYGSIPTGTTASVTAVYPQAVTRSIVEVYRVITSTPTPSAAGVVAGNLTSANTSITVPSGGTGIAGTLWRNPGAVGINWTNATEDNDVWVDNTSPASSAKVVGTGSVSVTSTITGAAAADVVMSIVAWAA